MENITDFALKLYSFFPEVIKERIKRSSARKLANIFLINSNEGLHSIKSGPVRGYKIYTNPFERPGYVTGDYERDIAAVIEEHCRPGMIVCDIGAHHGFFSLLLSHKIGKSGNCYSFEANILNFQWIMKSLSANKISNTTVENVAIGDKEDVVEFRSYLQQSGKGRIATFIPPHEKAIFSQVSFVPMTTLDTYLIDIKRVPHLDLIKIDVEGSENLVIQGAEAVLKKYHPVLILEIHEFRNPNKPINEVYKRLHKLDYKIHELKINQTNSDNKHILAISVHRRKS